MTRCNIENICDNDGICILGITLDGNIISSYKNASIRTRVEITEDKSINMSLYINSSKLPLNGLEQIWGIDDVHIKESEIPYNILLGYSLDIGNTDNVYKRYIISEVLIYLIKTKKIYSNMVFDDKIINDLEAVHMDTMLRNKFIELSESGLKDNLKLYFLLKNKPHKISSCITSYNMYILYNDDFDEVLIWDLDADILYTLSEVYNIHKNYKFTFADISTQFILIILSLLNIMLKNDIVFDKDHIQVYRVFDELPKLPEITYTAKQKLLLQQLI